MPNEDVREAYERVKHNSTPAALGDLVAACLLDTSIPESRVPSFSEEEDPPSSYTRITPTPSTPRTANG